MHRCIKDIHLTPEDIVLIKAYMDKFVSIGLKQEKTGNNKSFIIYFCSLLFLFSVIDIIIIKD